MEGYLTDDILVKVDRASMAVALEVRCPLLDHRWWSCPGDCRDQLKVRAGMSKWLLRQVALRMCRPD